MNSFYSFLPLVLLIGAAAATAQDQPDSPLGTLQPLVGNCYVAVFEEGETSDTHCWEAMLGENFIRDTHVIGDGESEGYRGESIYFVDPETGEAGYVYFNNLGGISRGSLLLEDGVLSTPDEVIHMPDGQRFDLSSTIHVAGSDAYEIRIAQMVDGEFGEPTSLHFRLIQD